MVKGDMQITAAGVTANDVQHAVKSTLATSLGVDESLLVVHVTSLRRLWQASAAQARQLAASSFAVSYEVVIPEAQAKLVKTQVNAITQDSTSFSQGMKTSLVAVVESSGRDPSVLSQSFAVAGFTVAPEPTTTSSAFASSAGMSDETSTTSTRRNAEPVATSRMATSSSSRRGSLRAVAQTTKVTTTIEITTTMNEVERLKRQIEELKRKAEAVNRYVRASERDAIVDKLRREIEELKAQLTTTTVTTTTITTTTRAAHQTSKGSTSSTTTAHPTTVTTVTTILHEISGEIHLVANGVTADDVKQVAKVTLAVSLGVSRNSLLVSVSVARHLDGHLQSGQTQPNSATSASASLVPIFKIEYTVSVSNARLASIKNQVHVITYRRSSFSKHLKSNLVEYAQAVPGINATAVSQSFSITNMYVTAGDTSDTTTSLPSNSTSTTTTTLKRFVVKRASSSGAIRARLGRICSLAHTIVIALAMSMSALQS